MYRGIESETDSTYAAVVDTDGQVLVQDGHTLTALYASTDEVSNNAHSQCTFRNRHEPGWSRRASGLGRFVRGNLGALLPRRRDLSAYL